jgi:hypothetical protein
MLDTESDYRTNNPALIQILFLHHPDAKSLLLLVKINFLHPPLSLLFEQFLDLFRTIFRPDLKLYSWEHLCSELIPFTLSGLFSFAPFIYLRPFNHV